MEQFSILFSKFDGPVARQNFSVLPTAHDYYWVIVVIYTIGDGVIAKPSSS